MKTVVISDKAELIQRAQEELSMLLSKNQPILLLLSGGSSFDLLENLTITNPNITVGILDERYSKDPAVNNFLQLQETPFFKTNKEKFKDIFDTSVQGEETLEEFAHRLDKFLKSWKEKNTDGIVVATLGMGPDGHTSGIMPFPENPVLFEGLFCDPRQCVVSYNAEGKNKYALRATTTIPFLKDVDYAVGYISGENKREAFERLMAEEGTLAETPSRVLHEMKDVVVFTDISL